MRAVLALLVSAELVRRAEVETQHFLQAAEGVDNEAWALQVAAKAAARADSLAETEEAEGQGKEWRLPQWLKKLDGRAKRIGAGAFGTVYLTKILCNGQQAAVKIQKNDKYPDWQGRMKREMAAMDMFSSARFVKGYEAGFDGNKYAILMEFASGGTMSGFMKKRNTPAEVLRLIAGLLDGLAEMHAKGAVHRDIKPDNVLVECQEGACHAKVADLGLACGVHPLDSCRGYAGTPLYIAPELIKMSSPKGSPPNDVWAAGMILYELTFGDLPSAISQATSIKDLERRIKGLNRDPSRWVPSSSRSRLNLGSQVARFDALLQGMLRADAPQRLSAAKAASMATELLAELGPVPTIGAAELPACWSQAAPSMPPRRPEPVRPVPIRPQPGKPERPQKPEEPLEPLPEGGFDTLPVIEGDEYIRIRGVMTNMEASLVIKAVPCDEARDARCKQRKFLDIGDLGTVDKRRYLPKKLRQGKWQIISVNNVPAEDINFSMGQRLLAGQMGSDFVVAIREL